MAKKLKRRSIFGFGRARSSNDFRRPRGRRIPGKVIVVVCEGEETEPNYFRALRQKFRLSNLNIRVFPGKGAPINVVNCAIDEKKKLDESADEVWCVLDTENPINNPSLKVAIEKAKRGRINLAVSNPSFEYWYFIHFECSNREFANGYEMKKSLKVYIPNYSESADIFARLDDLTPTALEHAEKLRSQALQSWDIFPNPSTGVDRLVQEIIELGKAKTYQ